MNARAASRGADAPPPWWPSIANCPRRFWAGAYDRPTMKAKIIAAVAVAGATLSAAPASADDDPPQAGSSCPSDQLGNLATTSDGTTVRCLATEQGGFSWVADTGAAGTIADLQQRGYTVNIDRVGSGPLSACKVTNVRNPVTITRTDRSGPGDNVVTIVVSKTVSVSLDCTGG